MIQPEPFSLAITWVPASTGFMRGTLVKPRPTLELTAGAVVTMNASAAQAGADT
jgi:hypothetical protein